MRYLEHSALNRLSVLLQKLDVGDRVIEGKLELFSTSPSLNNEVAIEKSNDAMINPHKINAKGLPTHFSKRSEMDLMINMTSAMNQCFPDYDFSSLTPGDFQHIVNLNTAYNTINYNLLFVVEKVFPGFVQEFWDAIQDAISLDDVEVYSYEPGGNSGPYNAENCLFSFDYFFHDKKNRRFLFLSSITKSKTQNYYTEDDDDDEVAPFDGIFKKVEFSQYDDANDEIESLTSSPPT